MFDSLLIANRGEIACRVIETTRRLGIRCIAVYSDADADARHVALADRAVRIGPAPARESYLRIPAIIEAARAEGADAVHPGYGFLAENADFAQACLDAGLAFVGPPPAAIRAMGDKGGARALAEAAGVPVLPGVTDEGLDDAALARAAARIGFPLVVKPVAGGGGKGMRIVAGEADLEAALAAARREAGAAFGDDRLVIERWLDRPRHVEVQLFADQAGNVVHLFERDCSVQRRHQKVVEEAPAVPARLRARLAEATVALARAVDYVGAGTVEFLVGGEEDFYFLEMNTRLQVEHRVSEMITGLDLVEWQLRVAAGEPLPRGQDEIALSGHAIEARLYAEDPARDFLPAAGRIEHLDLPAPGDDLRIDAGVRAGDVVSPHYDPLIAKIVAWGTTRRRAIARLAAALEETCVAGPATNRDFLRRLLAHEAFAAGPVDTGFVGREIAALAPPPETPDPLVLAFAALDRLRRRADAAAREARESGDPTSPWHRADGWRLNAPARVSLRFHDAAGAYRVIACPRDGGGWRMAVGDAGFDLDAIEADGETVAARIDGVLRQARVVAGEGGVTVILDREARRLADDDAAARADAGESAAGRLVAPMPGRVVAVMVEPGARVARGAPLMIVEAMKMEHTIAAPADGRVEAVHFAPGARVEEGVELVTLAAGDGD